MYTTVDWAVSNMDYFIRNKLFRVGGVAEEPGSMALFYNIYFGISLYYLNQKINNKTKIVGMFFLFSFCHFALFSNAGIALAIVSLILIFLTNKFQTQTISKAQLIWIMISFLALFSAIFIIYIFNFEEIQNSIEKFINKLMFDENRKYSSSGQRLKQWSRAIQNFFSRPIFGYGPGFGVNQDAEGYLSVYLTILADLGIMAFLFFFSFIERIFFKLNTLPIKTRSFLLFSLITSTIHLFIVADFYHAPFWILLVLIQTIYKENKTIKL